MSVWSEDELVMVSAVRHYAYCARSCALIHVEHVYDENVFTLRGSLAHVRPDEPTERTEDGVTVERALPIWSERYGLVGKADVVEFHPDGSVYPVEYKITPKRSIRHAVLQLCAQAMCLEEMLGQTITRGAIYSTSSHQRKEVEFSAEMRRQTEDIVVAVREMLRAGTLPDPPDDSRCPNCSLLHVCLPSGIGLSSSLKSEDFLFRPVVAEVAE